jgi:hypothetical protein
MVLELQNTAKRAMKTITSTIKYILTITKYIFNMRTERALLFKTLKYLREKILIIWAVNYFNFIFSHLISIFMGHFAFLLTNSPPPFSLVSFFILGPFTFCLIIVVPFYKINT